MGEIVVDLKLDFASEADRGRFFSAIEIFGYVLRVDGRRATIWRLFGRAIARLVEGVCVPVGRISRRASTPSQQAVSYRPRRSWTRREAEKSGYWPEGRYSFLEGEGGAKLLGNAVPDPVTVPPLDGIDGQAMKQNREMQVVASRQPGLAREAQSVSRPDRLPL